MGQFLQEWVFETMFQDINKHVQTAFWNYFTDEATDSHRQQDTFCQAIQYLHGKFKKHFLGFKTILTVRMTATEITLFCVLN